MKVEDGENLDVALQLAQAAKVKAPHLPEISDTLGLIYYKRNLFAFSAAAYADAVKYVPATPSITTASASPWRATTSPIALVRRSRGRCR